MRSLENNKSLGLQLSSSALKTLIFLYLFSILLWFCKTTCWIFERSRAKLHCVCFPMRSSEKKNKWEG